MSHVARVLAAASLMLAVFGSHLPSAYAALTCVVGGKVYVSTVNGAGPINGSPGNDVIRGSNGADTIDGQGGDDIICGRGGNDRIEGGDGIEPSNRTR